MKKLLIIQQDDAYFLFETMQVIEKNPQAFKDFELTLLVDQKALSTVSKHSAPVIPGITVSSTVALKDKFDISVNLSLRETSWDLHGLVESDHKIGPHRTSANELIVSDLWSTYLLTIKAKAPFLTFHLQDIYKNIIGIKSVPPKNNHHVATVRQIAYGTFNTNFFSADDQEFFLSELSRSFPQIPIRDITEIDVVEDLTDTIYIGPATLEALELCQSGATAIFAGANFQGFNLLPYSGQHLVVSTKGSRLTGAAFFTFIENELAGKQAPHKFALYRITHDDINAAFLEAKTGSDDNYPFYQSHVVLWNFLLNLTDVNLEISHCSEGQKQLLKANHEVLAKLLRLHDYAMSAVDHVMTQSKAKLIDTSKIAAEMKTIEEIDRIADQIAGSHQFLRPILDFYRIRRAQAGGQTLLEQSQATFLTYAEEHQALQALGELFSVTLRKNEVNI